MSEADLRYETHAMVAVLSLDRPAARNAYSDEMIDGLVAALDRAEADPNVRCIVITGTGPAFHAGGDLKQMREQTGTFAGGPVDLRRRYIDGIQRVPTRFAQCDKPTGAAINGAAIGAGLDLACMCDVRISSRTANFGSTSLKLDWSPGMAGPTSLRASSGSRLRSSSC